MFERTRTGLEIDIIIYYYYYLQIPKKKSCTTITQINKSTAFL